MNKFYKTIIISIFTVLMLGCSSKSELLGFYKLYNGRGGSPPYNVKKYAYVEFGKNNRAIYYIKDKNPIYANWKIKGDSIIIQSDKFVMETIFYEVEYDTYLLKYSPNTPVSDYGKLLETQIGDCDTFIVTEDYKILRARDFSIFNTYLKRVELSHKTINNIKSGKY